ncbi:MULTISPECIES: acetyl-CoA hydrolase/transferase C-terminal domain-containing protein [unclassified Pseudofrankia]|uniref:acetyl-CoA hydrolase/transferase C-terminal domain-containing protein n=1 Tax=unclassified Pseudofrankia TaxID=2994372 RepID=UPI0009F6A457
MRPHHTPLDPDRGRTRPGTAQRCRRKAGTRRRDHRRRQPLRVRRRQSVGSDGAGQRDPRAFCVVVTEYGIADLRGCTAREHADRLLEVAHPDHRAELATQWRRAEDDASRARAVTRSRQARASRGRRRRLRRRRATTSRP